MSTALSDQEPLVLVCGADNAYAMSLAVTVYSALANLRPGFLVFLYLIDGGVEDENKRRLLRVAESAYPNVTAQWVTPDIAPLRALSTGKWYSTANYLRLLTPDIIPGRFDRVIYLDSDLQVEADLGQLWTQDFKNCALLAVQDFKVRTVASEYGFSNAEELGLRPEMPYFNSGLMVINLARWRDDDVTQKVVQFTLDYPEQVKWADQDGLNATLAHDWRPLDPRWNVVSSIFSYEEWPETPFKEMIRPLRDDLAHHALVYHYAGGDKPWHPWLEHPARDRWMEYLKRSQWFTPGESRAWFTNWRRSFHLRKLFWKLRQTTKQRVKRLLKR